MCECMCVFLPEIGPEPDWSPAGLFEDVTHGWISSLCLVAHRSMDSQQAVQLLPSLSGGAAWVFGCSEWGRDWVLLQFYKI